MSGGVLRRRPRAPPAARRSRSIASTSNEAQGEALDKVRRAEAKTHRELLRGTRYLWLKRPENLTVKQLDWLDELLDAPLRPSRPTSWRCGLTTSTRSRTPTSAGVSTPLDHRGQRQRPGADHRVHRDAREPLGRRDPLASHPRQQRPARRPQLADPGSQTQSPRVPLTAQLQDDDLPRRRQAQPRTPARVSQKTRPKLHPPQTARSPERKSLRCPVYRKHDLTVRAAEQPRRTNVLLSTSTFPRF